MTRTFTPARQTCVCCPNKATAWLRLADKKFIRVCSPCKKATPAALRTLR